MNTRKIFIAASCLALNLSLAKIAATLSLPLYFDCVGTILAAALLPGGYAVTVAVLTSLLGGLIVNPYFAAYVGTQFAISLTAIAALRWGFFKAWWSSILAGVLIALVAVIVSAPVTAVLFGGVTLSGTTAINAVLIASGNGIWKSVIGGSLFVEAIDNQPSQTSIGLPLPRALARLLVRVDGPCLCLSHAGVGAGSRHIRHCEESIHCRPSRIVVGISSCLVAFRLPV